MNVSKYVQLGLRLLNVLRDCFHSHMVVAILDNCLV